MKANANFGWSITQWSVWHTILDQYRGPFIRLCQINCPFLISPRFFFCKQFLRVQLRVFQIIKVPRNFQEKKKEKKKRVGIDYFDATLTT
jgi:hypothetical protein